MRAPDFWQKTVAQSLIVRLLQPFGDLYGRIVQWRLAKPPLYQSTLPVICIGNMTMGGSGKTPVVQAIVKILQEQGAKPAILLRGYGGSGKGPFWVTLDMSAAQAGDEALLHARVAPTLVSADRVRGAQEIERCGYTHIVMDDGLQNPGLAKTNSVLVIDAGNPMGNGLAFPAGPLRETLAHILPRVQAVVLLGDDTSGIKAALSQNKPLWAARLEPLGGDKFAGRSCVAFAGIGRPEKFFGSLRACGASIAQTFCFADHHPYTAHELENLQMTALRHKALLVTTRKDWVRLPIAFQARTEVLDVALVWNDVAGVVDYFAHDSV